MYQKLTVMKNFNHNYSRSNVLILVLLTFFLHSCVQKRIPEFVGEWKTEPVKITVRTKPKKGKFEFTTGSAEIFLTIKSDNTADGFIGSAEFENARIKGNFGNPEKKGIAIKIKCGSVGKIFENDPLDHKDVEIWLGPLKGAIDAELRYTQGGSHFPMAGMIFTRAND